MRHYYELAGSIDACITEIINKIKKRREKCEKEKEPLFKNVKEIKEVVKKDGRKETRKEKDIISTCENKVSIIRAEFEMYVATIADTIIKKHDMKFAYIKKIITGDS